MDNIKTTALYQNIQIGIIKQLGEGCLTDMVLDVVMPIFEPFIEERLSNFKLYREAIEKTNRSIIVTNWKPSEQEKGALRTAIYVLTNERNFPKTAEQLKNILNAFEGEEPRKDWKPSEEQMEGPEGRTPIESIQK